jgi:hypothetical protein
MPFFSMEAEAEQYEHGQWSCGKGERQALRRLLMKHKQSRGLVKFLPQRELAARGESCTSSCVARDDEADLKDATSDMRGRLQYFAKHRSTGVSVGRSSYGVLKLWKTCQYKRPQMRQTVLSGGWKHLGSFVGSFLRAVDLHGQSVKDNGGNQRSFCH